MTSLPVSSAFAPNRVGWPMGLSTLYFTPKGLKAVDDDNNNENAEPELQDSLSSSNKSSNDDQRKPADDPISLDEMLDRPFFVPEDVPDNSPLKWFANLVEQDYVTAEALFASFFITLMVVATQEILRMQLYGEQYVPFAKGGAAAVSGGLF